MRTPGSSVLLNKIRSLNDSPSITKPKIAGTNVTTAVTVPHAISELLKLKIVKLLEKKTIKKDPFLTWYAYRLRYNLSLNPKLALQPKMQITIWSWQPAWMSRQMLITWSVAIVSWPMRKIRVLPLWKSFWISYLLVKTFFLLLGNMRIWWWGSYGDLLQFHLFRPPLGLRWGFQLHFWLIVEASTANLW